MRFAVVSLRTAIATAVGIGAVAQAADVTVAPTAGSGFVVKNAANTADRLRVNEDGTVWIPVLASGPQQATPVCVSAGGLVGPCAPGTGGAVGPQGPAGPMGATGPAGAIGPTGPAGSSAPAGTVNQTLRYDGSNALATNNKLLAFSDGGLVAGGAFNTGQIPVTGAGTRMMWSPVKAAFRAGYASGTQWDTIGFASIALGSDTTASANYSFAVGTAAIASDTAAIALGDSAKATAAEAVAIGNSAQASKLFATAIGQGALASGTAATAIGQQLTASGDNATAMGNRTTAGDTNSVALGHLTIADCSAVSGTITYPGDSSSSCNSTAMGVGSHAQGFAATAMGSTTTASGNYSTATGEGTVASGRSSTAMGYSAVAKDNFSFVWGGESSNPNSVSHGVGSFSVYAPGGAYFYLASGSCIASTGAAGWACSSDRNLKTRVVPVDGHAVLDKLLAMPVATWAFKAAPQYPHIGPMAQDFKAAFGLGDGDDKHIGSTDAQGVAFAAIQGLNAKLEALIAAQNERIAQQNRRLGAQEERLASQRRQIAALQVQGNEIAALKAAVRSLQLDRANAVATAMTAP